MFKIINFIALSVFVFVILAFILIYFNPLNLRDRIVSSVVNYSLQINQKEKINQEYIKEEGGEDEALEEPIAPLLSEDQIEKLESYGVDTSLLPKEISPAMADCFEEKLGEERVAEIISGSEPNAIEIFKTKDCLSK